MPLNTEFRVFYDFDKKEILGVFNYWDEEVMEKYLKRDEEDYITFKGTIGKLDVEFDKLKHSLINSINVNMPKVEGLKGKWLIDFMYVDGDMYLIDMELGRSSYYRSKVIAKVGETNAS